LGLLGDETCIEEKMKIDGYKRSEKYTYFLDNLAIFNNTRWTRGRFLVVKKGTKVIDGSGSAP
jgi:hypothetical protein